LKTKLQYLYKLQQIDSSLDELQEEKGDLPGQVRELESQLEAVRTQHSLTDQAMKTAFTQRDNADNEIIGLKAKMEKYKSQQFAVRTNREYDALTREMDGTVEAVRRLEKEMEQLEIKGTTARTAIEDLVVKIAEMEKQLEERRAALAEVSKSTEVEELEFNHQRQKVVARIAKPDLASYERIRRAKRGMAVVPVKKGACGGCFNRVPPQKLLELRQNDRLYTCERCGRIIVSDEIAETSAKIL
jgi:uncharacterized protein